MHSGLRIIVRIWRPLCKRKLKRELSRRLAELGHGTSFVRGSLD